LPNAFVRVPYATFSGYAGRSALRNAALDATATLGTDHYSNPSAPSKPRKPPPPPPRPRQTNHEKPKKPHHLHRLVPHKPQASRPLVLRQVPLAKPRDPQELREVPQTTKGETMTQANTFLQWPHPQRIGDIAQCEAGLRESHTDRAGVIYMLAEILTALHRQAEALELQNNLIRDHISVLGKYPTTTQ
jgi:hypothetical protein